MNTIIFINTRPTSRAETLTTYLQHQGVEVIDLPLLELVPKALDSVEQQALQQIDDAKIIVLVSEIAVKYGLSALSKITTLANITQLPLTWVAVGQATADCFNQTWQSLSDSQPPAVIFPRDKQHQNNEGMLTLPEIGGLQPTDSVQIWRGIGGREWLAEALKVTGIAVALINFYQRQLPIASIEKFNQIHSRLASQQPTIVLISSLTAWQHWQQLVIRQPALITSCHYLVLQSRIAQFMRQQYPDIALTIIADLQPSTIADSLTTYQ